MIQKLAGLSQVTFSAQRSLWTLKGSLKSIQRLTIIARCPSPRIQPDDLPPLCVAFAFRNPNRQPSCVSFSGEAVRDFAELIWPNNASTARKNPTPPPTEGKTAEKITTPLEEALSSAKATVVGVGVNCTAPQHVAGVLHILAEAAKKRAGTVDGGGDRVTNDDEEHQNPGKSSGNGVCRSSDDSSSGSSSSAMRRMGKVNATVHDTVTGNIYTPREGSNNTYIHSCGPMNSNEIALVAYPNSGEEWDAKAREWVQDTGFRGDRGALDFGRMSQDWFAAGATVLGGCCRTTPAHIQEMNEVLVSRHIT